MTGIQRIEIPTNIITKRRPIIISSTSLALGLTRFQMSIVNMTLQELNTDVREDIKAAIITATIRPLAPGGIMSIISFGYAIFEHPTFKIYNF